MRHMHKGRARGKVVIVWQAAEAVRFGGSSLARQVPPSGSPAPLRAGPSVYPLSWRQMGRVVPSGVEGSTKPGEEACLAVLALFGPAFHVRLLTCDTRVANCGLNLSVIGIGGGGAALTSHLARTRGVGAQRAWASARCTSYAAGGGCSIGPAGKRGGIRRRAVSQGSSAPAAGAVCKKSAACMRYRQSDARTDEQKASSCGGQQAAGTGYARRAAAGGLDGRTTPAGRAAGVATARIRCEDGPSVMFRHSGGSEWSR
jgi:hypothetical protein